MRILDLFCGAGAASIGYHEAGWEVVGCDIARQKHYPFPFIQADALSLARLLPFFDAVHASPPCQFATEMNNDKSRHQNLIPGTRRMLQAWGGPYVIENVPGARAHLIDPVMLNGFMFGLQTRTSDGVVWHLERERLFETNWPIRQIDDWTRKDPVIGVYGGHVRNRSKTHGGRKTADFPGEDKPRLMREAMGIPSRYPMTMGEMSEAIPPVYTTHLGSKLMHFLNQQRKAA